MILELIITLLATYAVSALLTHYDGPNHVLLKLRQKYPDSALQCLVCTSCYVVWPMFLVFMLGWGIYIAPLAIVGAIILWENR